MRGWGKEVEKVELLLFRGNAIRSLLLLNILCRVLLYGTALRCTVLPYTVLYCDVTYLFWEVIDQLSIYETRNAVSDDLLAPTKQKEKIENKS